MITRVPDLKRGLHVAGVLLAAATALGGCKHTEQEIVTGTVPNDYRQRHPIVIQEASRTTEVFVGQGRGGLTAAQRADIMGLSQAWLREGTGGIIIDMPVGTVNARTAADSLHEIQAIFAAAGIPPRGVTVRNYRPSDPRLFATIRVSYPRIMADAGPCGVWPEDIGPSIKNKGYFENRQYDNFGCAYQRNLAAMVDNPSDLVQPRAETPPMESRRNVMFDKYRKGEPTNSQYPEADKAKLSEAGK
ncbi:CpaD family pilus assembly protein [Bradyrhizobium sp. SYSU BS000235]|uniref:CpaD family pilus assembly protein n=1 Tax=Bradyrhizobium sp. SYSU BS000235 TaxID=3411332 RepID=UPI003C733E28